MPFVRIAVAFALLAAVGSQQLSTCAGWDSSARARMACCERSGDCDDVTVAAACCAAGEQDDHAQTGGVMLAPAPVTISAPRPPLPSSPALTRSGAFTASAPYAFRNAILLI